MVYCVRYVLLCVLHTVYHASTNPEQQQQNMVEITFCSATIFFSINLKIIAKHTPLAIVFSTQCTYITYILTSDIHAYIYFIYIWSICMHLYAMFTFICVFSISIVMKSRSGAPPRHTILYTYTVKIMYVCMYGMYYIHKMAPTPLGTC